MGARGSRPETAAGAGAVRSERALRDVVSRRARAYADADSELGASRNIWNPSSRGLCSADG